LTLAKILDLAPAAIANASTAATSAFRGCFDLSELVDEDVDAALDGGPLGASGNARED